MFHASEHTCTGYGVPNPEDLLNEKYCQELTIFNHLVFLCVSIRILKELKTRLHHNHGGWQPPPKSFWGGGSCKDKGSGPMACNP